MHCPRCGEDSRVIDSRELQRSEEDYQDAIRRRRLCMGKDCGYRFTTYELRQHPSARRQMLHMIRQLREHLTEVLGDNPNHPDPYQMQMWSDDLLREWRERDTGAHRRPRTPDLRPDALGRVGAAEGRTDQPLRDVPAPQ
jgi:hypothetical protein